MNHLLRWCVTALLLLRVAAFAAAASAASAAPAAPSIPASDFLSLSGAQEQLLWTMLGAQSAPARSSFRPDFYIRVPASIKLHPMPSRVLRQIPELEAYRYATVNGRLLIVNPTDRRIVDIVGAVL
ncbi:MAG TPA: DUF1236 domain-containing protein [Xanthobacteraceae bacterium]|jgi:hypothetical protein